MQLNNNGLLKNTKLAKERYTNSQKDENSVIDNYSNQIDNYEVVGNGRDTITISKEEYESMKQDIEKLKENNFVGIDTKNLIKTVSKYNSNTLNKGKTDSYTATEDCWAYCFVNTITGTNITYSIDNVFVGGVYSNNSNNDSSISWYPLKKGQTFKYSVHENCAPYEFDIYIYGIL